MNFPLNIHLGALVIQSHMVFEILAYVVGYRYYLYLRKRTPDLLSADQRIWLVICGGFGAAVGSKLLGFFEHPELWGMTKESLLYFMAAKTIVGGVLGGLIGVEIAKKCMGITLSSGDLFCFPVILGIAIGRIGCFLAGVTDDTAGLPTASFLGIDMGDGIPRHPTQLYEIVALVVIWAVLAQVKKRFMLKSGSLFKLFMASYLTWRVLIEFIKPVHPVLLGLSAIQLACLAGIFYYRRVFLCPRSLLKDYACPAVNTSISN